MLSKKIINFSNKYVLQKIEENKKTKILNIIQQLKPLVPKLSDDEIICLYNKSISIHQKSMQGNGDFLEKEIIEPFLEYNKISYKTQVTINKEGKIVGFNEKKKRCYHVIDFVLGDDIEIGKSITNFQVLSCKTTCRERWTQDNWTLTLNPNKYLLITLSNDYPSRTRFNENSQRKIVTCSPKQKDDRKYKLNFEDLLNEI